MQLNERLTSANGEYYAFIKDRGDFYLCQQDGTPYLTIKCGAGNTVNTWRLRDDGVVVFVTGFNDTKWQTAVKGSGGNENNYAALQDNGDFIIVADGQTVWKAPRGSYRADDNQPFASA